MFHKDHIPRFIVPIWFGNITLFIIGTIGFLFLRWCSCSCCCWNYLLIIGVIQNCKCISCSWLCSVRHGKERRLKHKRKKRRKDEMKPIWWSSMISYWFSLIHLKFAISSPSIWFINTYELIGISFCTSLQSPRSWLYLHFFHVPF